MRLGGGAEVFGRCCILFSLLRFANNTRVLLAWLVVRYEMKVGCKVRVLKLILTVETCKC